MSRMNTHNHNAANRILIAGAGMVGLTAAIAFARAGFSVVVVDKSDLTQAPLANTAIQHDGRTIAVAAGVQDFFAQLGIWDAEILNPCPIMKIQVAQGRAGGQRYLGQIDWSWLADTPDATPNQKPLGHIVENRRLLRHLLTEAEKAGVRLVGNFAVEDVQNRPNAVTLRDETGQEISGALLLAVDGRQSKLRDLLGIACRRHDYRQTAVIATLSHTAPHHHTAYEYFMAGGPLAMLPMHDQCSHLVWNLPTDTAKAFVALDEPAFEALLQWHFPWLGPLKLVGRRQGYPLTLAWSKQLQKPRVFLLGDAAHGVHPIAGQGFNLAMHGLRFLLAECVAARRLGLAWWDSPTLSRAETQQRGQATPMVLATHGLNALFAHDWPLLRITRGLGLNAVNRCPPLKRFFMLQAMGLPQSSAQSVTPPPSPLT
jgi:2-octaprenyl-6-methoxyphenol hydroxylase